jgi:hypothetical protein
MSLAEYWYAAVTVIASYAAGLVTWQLIRDLRKPDE